MQHSYFSPYVETYHVPFVGAGSVQELSWLSIFLRIWLQWRPLGTNGQILSTNPLPPISVVWSSGQYFLPTNCWSNVNRWSNVFMIFFAPRIFNWPIFAVFSIAPPRWQCCLRSVKGWLRAGPPQTPALNIARRAVLHGIILNQSVGEWNWWNEHANSPKLVQPSRTSRESANNWVTWRRLLHVRGMAMRLQYVAGYFALSKNRRTGRILKKPSQSYLKKERKRGIKCETWK